MIGSPLAVDDGVGSSQIAAHELGAEGRWNPAHNVEGKEGEEGEEL